MKAESKHVKIQQKTLKLSIFSDEYEDEEEEEDDIQFKESILQIYKNRHKSPEDMRQWLQIEKEIFNKKEELQMEPLVKNEPEIITSCAKFTREFSQDPIPKNLPNNPNLHLLKQRFPIRQISADEGCYTHSSTNSR